MTERAYDTYESPLAARNASPEMLRLFSPQHKFGLWRRLWLELARCERELGVSRISEDALLAELDPHFEVFQEAKAGETAEQRRDAALDAANDAAART